MSFKILWSKIPAAMYASTLQKAMMYDAELRNTGTVDGILNLCPDSIVDAAMSRRLTANSVGTWLKSYTDMKFAGCPKFLKKLPRTRTGTKYVIDDIEQQTVMV